MKSIQLPVAELRAAMTGFSKIIRKPSLPILNTLLIQRDQEGWVRITATDLCEFATLRLECPQEPEPAAMIVSFPELLKLTKSCGRDEAIELTLGPGPQVVLSYPLGTNRANISLAYTDPEEFPPSPKFAGEPRRLASNARQAMLEAFQCASTDDTRFVINGVCLDVSQGSHYVVATDGKLLYSSNSIQLPIQESVIVRNSRFITWKSFAGDGEWQVLVQPKQEDATASIQFSSRRWTFVTRLIEGNYPDWRQVLLEEDSFETKAVLDDAGVEAILNTIQRIPSADSEHNPIRLVAGSGKLLLQSDSQSDPVVSEVEGAFVSGPEVSIRLNREFLIKALRFGLSTIKLINASTPLCFCSGGKQVIAMPLKPSKIPPAAVGVDGPTSIDSAGTQQSTDPVEPVSESEPSGNENPEPMEATNSVDQAIQFADSLRTSFQQGLTGLRDLASKLRQIQRENRANARETQFFRNRLKDLQSIKL